MTYLIGLNGRRGAGKDTAYSFIHQWGEERGVSVGRRGFADALKLSFARLFIPDMSVDEAVIFCDMIKGEGASTLQIEWGGGEAQKSFVRHELSGRLALQRYGTEAHRDVFGTDFWIDVLLPLATIEDYGRANTPQWPRNFMHQLDQEPPEICVVTDVRFMNESQRVHQLEGKVWEIRRGGYRIVDDHSSEAELPPEEIDRVIHNNVEGDFTEFQQQINSALDGLVDDE